MLIKELLIYYNINDNFKELDNYHFVYNNKNFFIKKNVNLPNINSLFFKYPFSYPIKNIFNSYYTNIDNNVYVIFLSFFPYNQIPTINSIKYISSIDRHSYYVNYYLLWKRKLDYLINYSNDKDTFFEYFYGLSIFSLKLLDIINFNNLSYGICINDYECYKSKEEFFCPLNYKYGAIVSNYVRYIKISYFLYNKKKSIDVIELYNFTKDDILFFIIRLFFPDYYFYLLKSNNQEFINIEAYLRYVKGLIKDIKKRQDFDLSIFENYINQLL